MGMSSVFKGADKRWYYASLDENGKSICKKLTDDVQLERAFVEFLPDQNPASYTVAQLQTFWKQFMNTRKRDGK